MFAVRLTFLSLIVSVALATKLAAAEKPPQPVVKPPRTEAEEPDVGPVHSARSLLGAPVKNRAGETLGRIEDVGLDIGRGTVAEVFLMSAKQPRVPAKQPQSSGQATPGNRESVTVPITLLQWSAKGNEVILEPTTGIVPKPAKNPEPDDKSQVVLLSTMDNVPVHNTRGDNLGQIVDFGLARQKGLIAYAVLALKFHKESADVVHPIPLTGFVVPSDGKWILEVPEDVLANTPSFKRSAWPDTVSRAWTEYVHVRYGRSPFGGVRRELQTEKTN